MTSYTFKSGARVEGTPEQILSIAKSLGETVDLTKLGGVPRGYYHSEHSGLMKISEMNASHIRNGLLKLVRKYYENLSAEQKGMTNFDFQKNFVKFTENPTIEDLFNELSKRR